MPSRLRQSRHYFVEKRQWPVLAASGGAPPGSVVGIWQRATSSTSSTRRLRSVCDAPRYIPRSQQSDVYISVPLPRSGPPPSSLSSSSSPQRAPSSLTLVRSLARSFPQARKKREGAKTLLDTERPRASRRPEEQ